ncbi:Sodium:neurotransmitter symporter family protein [Planctopirus ephydatiae]|uniref:Sodium:neurotransmitter symporter family protein n=1 Tax=Planctopirus ephydatiae TaxID=2528019 RepID=A0A518GMC5_9PLAN|nr:hypothetical protein [Planctopirus ephydatiae]QDV29812.1 Sodium:neurotransmitter symporter family protein [Planctopirus ephydatiae]
MSSSRGAWASRIGLVLAMAGNAVGLGNFLRFPGLCTKYGGAFLIPYFIALLLLGIPLMWVEWSIGRYGGQFGHSTAPGVFDKLWRNRFSKYLGALGVALPLLITIYYCYIESWCLAYTWYSVTRPFAPQEGDTQKILYSPVSPQFVTEVAAWKSSRALALPITRTEWEQKGQNLKSANPRRFEKLNPPAIFSNLDTNRDDSLTTDELTLQSSNNSNLMRDLISQDRESQLTKEPITQAEWLAATEDILQHNPEMARLLKLPSDAAFTAIDLNKNSALDPPERLAIEKPLANARTQLFLDEYLGSRSYEDPAIEATYFRTLWPAVFFWIVTVAINCLVLGTDINAGIERLAKIAMPALIIFAIILAVRVLTFQSPSTAEHGYTVWDGMNFIWEPRFDQLANPEMWLAAAGQIFFTLSVGTGSILCYASYLKRNDDCALTGLATASTNEFCEVVLGGSIAIPMAVAVFGLFGAQAIASGGSFNIGFVAMPLIFEQMPLGRLFGPIWFALLFFAGITSSVALASPMMAFLQDEFGISRKSAAGILFGILIGFGIPVVVFPGSAYLDQLDFWAGTLGLFIFALIELIIFGWIFGGKEMWAEMTRGAQIPMPRFVYYLVRYVAPIYMFVILGLWILQEWQTLTSVESFLPEQRGYIWMARASVVTVIGLVALLVGLAWAIKNSSPPPERRE